jgi:hypothetical protein
MPPAAPATKTVDLDFAFATFGPLARFVWTLSASARRPASMMRVLPFRHDSFEPHRAGYTVVCLTLAKWETVSGRFGGYLSYLPTTLTIASMIGTLKFFSS